MRTRYINGIFYVMTDAFSTIDELWTEDGYIIAPPIDQAYDRCIDCQGAVVFPGFVDAHLHIAGYGEKLSLPNVARAKDISEILSIIQAAFKQQFLYVQGYVECGLKAHHLDTISTDYPIIVRHADYHSLTVNSFVLKQYGMTQSDGCLFELDALKVMENLPKYSQDQLKQYIEKAITSLHAYGITGGHSDDLHYFNGFVNTVAAFEDVLTKHPFRTHLLMHYLEVDHFLNSSRSWLDQSPYCQLGAVKIFYDGTLTSKTSLMAHPFPATNQYGERIFSPPVFQQLIEKMRRYDLPIAVHTIGDQALDELADYLLQYPVKKGLHDRIIHGSFAKYTTIEKLKKLPIIIDIQPQFVTTDFPHALGFVPHNTELIYPWKTYLDAGLIICGSSDAPVEVPDPLFGISSAWRRKGDDGIIYQPEQQLSMFDAIRLYTTLSNVPTYHTSTRGYLKPGFIADFTMLNHDILKHPEFIDQAKVVMTVIDDKVVFKKE